LTGRPGGFDAKRFFDGVPTRSPVPFLEGARLGQLLHESFRYPPVRLADGTAMWLYIVVDNNLAAFGPSGPSRTQPFLVFSTALMPYAANAQFSVSRFDFSNYALRLS
jgi:hypothetical protein